MASSYPTASSLGILANGTDQTSALNTALSNSNYSGIIFDYSAPAAVTMNGTVTATGKVLQFLAGNTLTGTGTLVGGFIDGDYNTQLWDTTLLIKPQGTVGKYYSLRWSGATGNGSTDDWAAIQNDINICTYNGLAELYLPAGRYAISKGLLFRKDSGGQYQGLTPPSINHSSFLAGINLTGDGIAYDGASGQTCIILTNADSFAIGLERVKGFKGRGLFCTGVNTGLASYSLYQVMQDPTVTFLTNGSRDNMYSPHCGIIVDPFADSSTISTDQYPDFTGYYVETSSGGSTEVVIEDSVFRYFTVGRAVGINGFSKNGEIINFTNCWADFNKVSLATGESQIRTAICHYDHVWGGTMVVYDSVSYGSTHGVPVTSIGLNLAGAVRYLCSLGNWISNGLFIKDAHIESLYSLGGNFTGSADNQLTIEDSWVNLQGSTIGGSAADTVTQPMTVFSGGVLKMSNCLFFQYGATVPLPLTIYCNAFFENCFLEAVPLNGHASGNSFKDCDVSANAFGDNGYIFWGLASGVATGAYLFTTGMSAMISTFLQGAGVMMKQRRKTTSNAVARLAGTFSQMYRDIVGVDLAATTTLSTLSYTTNTATFSLSTSSVDYKNLMVGDNLLFATTDEFGNTNILTVFGQVSALSGGTVTLSGIAPGLNTTTAYQLYIYRNEFMIPELILGDVTSGSSVVSGVVIESTAVVPLNVPIYLPHFPIGTYIVSYNSGTAQITMSNDATLTEANVAITSANWIGEEIGYPYLTNAYAAGYKKGDRIYNSVSAIFPNITYWECTKSGITNSSRLPEFVAFPGPESVSYSSTSVTGLTADAKKVVFLTATANSITYGIDPAAFVNLEQTLFGIISGANTISIVPSSGTINGAASFSLGNNQSIRVYSNGTDLFIIG